MIIKDEGRSIIKIIACLFLLTFTICIFSCERQAKPKWVKIHEGANFVALFDKSSKINMENGILRYWLKFDYTEKGRPEAQKNLSLSRQPLYSLVCVEIRCAYKDLRFSAETHYDGDDKVIRSKTQTEEQLKKAGWEPIAPDSVGEGIYQALCK
jgi:hypothetical protein